MDIDLTLDEIIAKKRTKERSTTTNKKFIPKRNTLQKVYNKTNFKPQQQQIEDARNKIVARQRAKIVDAREVLLKSTRKHGFDARQRLIERKQDEVHMLPDVASVHKGRLGNRIVTMDSKPGARIETVLELPKRAVRVGVGNKRGFAFAPKVPRGYVDYDNMEDLEQEEYRRAADYTMPQLQVQQPRPSEYLRLGGLNKLTPSPPPQAQHGIDIWTKKKIDAPLSSFGPVNHSVDPFDIYKMRRNRSGGNISSNLDIDMGNGAGLMYDRQQSNISSELRARLHTSAPDPRLSHGIYANENNVKKLLTPPTSINARERVDNGGFSPTGYRIVVSNLHSDVTTADIKELFSEIGPMYDARVVRPGTAEVIYKTLFDAEHAVDTYHNRQLDGQPMTCMLVKPRSSNRPTAPAIGSQSASAAISSVSCDIDTLHSVLFGER